MKFSPNLMAALSVLVLIEQAIGGGTVLLTNAIPEAWIPGVKSWCLILAFIGTAILSAGHFFAGPGTGPLAAAPTVKEAQTVMDAAKKAALFLIGCLLAWTLMGDNARAQTKKAAAAPKPTSTAPACPGDPLGRLICDIEAVKADIVAKAIAAIQEADADAGTLTNPADPMSFRDPIAHACYPEQVKFLQSLPAATPIQSPEPFNLIVLFQRKRDFVAQVKAGLPTALKLGCSALLGDEIQTAISTLALVGVKILPTALTAIFPAAAPITLPALNLMQ